MGLKQDDKVAVLRARIEELKTQLAEVKTQRDNARADRGALQSQLQAQRGENQALHQTCDGPRRESQVKGHTVEVPPEFREDHDKFLAWCRHFGHPSFFNDALAAWARNTDAFRSPKFVEAYQRGMNSGHKIGRPKGSDLDIHIEWRVHMVLWAASHAAGLEGDFVECGVNTGMCSISICSYLDFNSLGKDFYLFDTYRGIPEEQMSSQEKAARIAENAVFYEECYETAVQNFAPWPRCRLIRGKVPDTLQEVSISKVAYLHLDMNIAEPERAALEFFWDRMVPGGVILLDDYGFSSYRAQYDTANEFAASKGVVIATLPTGQGLLLKR